MDTEELDEMERLLHRQLAELRREFEARAKPVIDQLQHINSMKPMPPIILSMPSRFPEA